MENLEVNTKNLKDMIGHPILDIPCKLCGSDDTYICDDDEVEFEPDGIGHYYVIVVVIHAMKDSALILILNIRSLRQTTIDLSRKIYCKYMFLTF